MPPLVRHPWQIMQDVLFALIIRELKTRFGSNRLGYFWALAEPMMQAAMLALIFTLIGRTSISGVSVAMFMLVAILPFTFFSKLLIQLSAAIQANKGLLGYRQVTAFDPIIARVVIEAITFLVVYLLLMLIMACLGFHAIPENLLQLLMISGFTLMLSIGLGLMFCVAISYWSDSQKLISMIMRPMFFISGIMFCATMIPSQYWHYFSWNPLFHMTELSRDAYFHAYQTPIGELDYLAQCAILCFGLGMMVFQINRHRFIG